MKLFSGEFGSTTQKVTYPQFKFTKYKVFVIKQTSKENYTNLRESNMIKKYKHK